MTAREISAGLITGIRLAIYKARGHRVPDSDIASRLGVSSVTFSRIVTGVQAPSLATFFRICKLYISRVEDIPSFISFINSYED